MTDDAFELSRRKALAGIGTIGVASVGAGMGTSAFFSDVEQFENNRLVAGAFDLKVDWEEHYSDWSDDEVAALSDIVMIRDDDGDGSYADELDQVPDGYVGLPDPENPLIAIPESDVESFQDATSIEAMPDLNNDGVQDDLAGVDVCAQPWDTPDVLDPRGANTLADGPRTDDGRTEDTTLLADGTPAPLVYLEDVKPGDFGELTLSFHLCDNPGYVWLTGGLVDADENGNTEPEGNDPDEDGPGDAPGADLFENEGDESDDPGSSDPANTTQERVELLDELRTLLWYDEDGDNIYEPGGGTEAVDLMLVFDQSESMNAPSGTLASDTNPEKLASAVDGAKSLVDAVGPNTDLGLTFFSGASTTGVVRNLGSARADIKQDLDDLDGPDTPSNPSIDDNQPGDEDNLIGGTDIAGGIEATRAHLNDTGRPGAQKVMVILSDGEPTTSGAESAATAAKDDDIEIFTIAYGSNAAVGLMEDLASTPKPTHAFVSSGPSDIVSIFGQIGQILGGEECFFRGSMRELLVELSDGHGIPLDGNRDTPFDELGGDPASEARDVFVNSTNNFVGLAWYLPVDHANEIQTDSVAFDLGFYTEQARHNDGAGQSGDDGTRAGEVFVMDLSTGVADWTVVSSPDGTTGDAVASGKHPAWATVDISECSAQWVDPYDNAPTESDPVGDYVYELEFEVPAPSARDLVVYAFGSDNPGRLLLDGTEVQSHQVSNAFDPLNETVVAVEDVPVGAHILTAEVENLSGGGQNPTGLFVCAALE